jgi:hypothetical protein
MGRIADAAGTGAIAQLSIVEIGKTGADIRFGYETDAETEADQAFQGVAAYVMAFNSGTILGRDELGYQNILKLAALIKLTQ